ncbi:MAG TPA: hypothetical protein VJ111_00795 [Chitinophagaceae bacterium]|nr:hypothetical protein [Chitinophagaceae bacterium]
MSDKMRKSLQEGYNRLKKALKKALSPQREKAMPQLILQPYRNKQRFER